MAKIQLSPPWAIRVREIEELFRYDKEIHVIYDEDEYTVNLYVDNACKAYWLGRLLPQKYNFGNVTLIVKVVPSNDTVHFNYTEFTSLEDQYKCIFENNSAVSNVVSINASHNLPLVYVVFKKVVVQYFNDNLCDLYGQCSTLYQEIAARVLNMNTGVFYCTEKNPSFLSLDLTDYNI